MGRLLAIFGTLLVISTCWREILLAGFFLLGINEASRGVHDVAETVGLAQTVPGEIIVAKQTIALDANRNSVTLTLTNMFPHEVYANVAVCAFRGPLYYDVSERYWYGSDNFNRSADEHVGDRQVIVTMFVLTHQEYTMPLEPYENGIFDSSSADPIIYVPMNASEVLVNSDTVVWCKFASNFEKLADMVPNLVDSQGNVIGQHVTWDGPGRGVPQEQSQSNLEFNRRYINSEFDAFVQANLEQH